MVNWSPVANLVAVAFFLAYIFPYCDFLTQKIDDAVCGTIGHRIAGNTVSELVETGLRECVGACRANGSCTAVNHFSFNATCHLVHAVDYPESPRRMELVNESFGVYVKPTCVVTVLPSWPFSFKFVLPEQTAPFGLQFTIRGKRDGIIALATGRRYEDIFCHVTIGGWDNDKAAIRTGDLNGSHDVLLEHAVCKENKPQLNALEDRTFWLTYVKGLLKIGKGVREGKDGADGVPIMQWDVGSLYDPAPSKVHVAITAWRNVEAVWTFDQFCN